jgi:transcriptional regulator with XRE-family HTH domain
MVLPLVGPSLVDGTRPSCGCDRAEAMTREVIVTLRARTYPRRMSSAPIGTLVKEWRSQRRRSQMDLAHEVGVSTRHLSFVETGRSRPSPELVLALADRLDVPLRARNTLLLAAGYAPRYSQLDLDAEPMRAARTALTRLLDAHDPYPGVVIDRQWNVVVANAAAQALLAEIPAAVLAPRINVFRVCLHPDGLAARTLNFDDWATYLLGQIRRTVVLTGDADLAALERELLGYPNLPDAARRPDVGEWSEPPLLVPFRLALGAGVEISLFTTLTTFGTPRDVTLDELAVELFFPADDASEAILRGGA